MGHKMCTDEHWYCKRPRSAMTRLRVLELGTYDNYPATKVLLKPITGRRHQLRVHCSALGHTIVGDFSYRYLVYPEVTPSSFFSSPSSNLKGKGTCKVKTCS